MNVAFIIWTGAYGGAETQTWRLASALRDQYSVAVGVVILRDDGSLGRAIRNSGVPVHAVGASSALDLALHPSLLRFALDSLGPDVIVLGGYGLACTAIRRIMPNVPVVVIEHGGILLNPKMLGLKLFGAALAGRTLYASTVRAEVAVSRYMIDIQRKLPHACPLTLIANSVDTNVFRPSAGVAARAAGEPLRVVAAGRLAPYKGFRSLIKAVARCNVRGKPPQVVLTIAGSGSDKDRLQSDIRRMGVADAVRLVGRVDDMAAFWPRGDVACVPSQVRESFGLTAAEAQACGLPVVATDVGALPEVVRSGETGQVVPRGDDQALAFALGRYALDSELVAKHGSSARRRAVKYYSLDRAAQRYFALLSGLGDGRRAI